MLDNKSVLISVISYDAVYITKLLSNKKVNYSNLRVYNNCVHIKINKSDFVTIKDLFGNNVSIIKFYGINCINHLIKDNTPLVLGIIVSFILLYVLSNTIFDITINTQNDDLKKIISDELTYNNIKKYSFKKNYIYVNMVKDKLLNDNKDKLEWIEITNIGTKYIVDLAERVIVENKGNNNYSNIVSKKDALIKKIIKKNGELTKDVNEYVHKGEIIISGNIYKNDDIVNVTNALGEVYGEVWYTVNVTIPFNYVSYETTGKTIKHYYLDIFGHHMNLIGVFNSDYTFSTSKVILDKPYLFFKLIKEDVEVFKYEEYKVTKDEAIDEAIKRSIDIISSKLSTGEYVIDKKVLKIDEYSSKINVEIFYRVYENITSTQYIEE